MEWDGSKVEHTDAEWEEILGRNRYDVMRGRQRERGFIGAYVYTKTPGVYCCAACKLPLFDAKDKYDAGSGWPCFSQPIDKKNVYYREDYRLPFKRYEIACRRCDSHLGHVFNDGPPPKNLRYCVNSIALFLK
ncbi:MAG: peptide-methionine (R)-S-oxide reductase MsrB [Verrucomicrobiota bacterium]|nr:peptide-methionine (R)-S-oxide reductase MsrB [Verrucomicrobiota bacterium]